MIVAAKPHATPSIVSLSAIAAKQYRDSLAKEIIGAKHGEITIDLDDEQIDRFRRMQERAKQAMTASERPRFGEISRDTLKIIASLPPNLSAVEIVQAVIDQRSQAAAKPSVHAK